MENVSKLPDELWLKIISFLPREDIFQNVALVNRFFHRLTKDPSLVTKILIDEIYYWHFNAYQQLLDRTTMLKELNFHRCDFDYVDSLLTKSIQTSAILKSITISNNCMVRLSTESLTLLSKLGQHLHNLDLSGVNIDSRGLMQVMKMNNLKTLKLGKSADFHTNHLVELTKKCTKLESLCLENSKFISNEALQQFCFARKKTLKRFQFSTLGFPNWIFRAPIVCKNLAELVVTHLDDGGEFHFNYKNSRLKSLKILNMDLKLSFRPNDLILLLSILDFERIESITISNSRILYDDVFEAIVSQPSVYLKKIVIEKCPNVDFTNLAISTMVRNFPSLKVFDISNNIYSCARKLSAEYLCKVEDYYKVKIMVDSKLSSQMSKYRNSLMSYEPKVKRIKIR